MARYYPPCTNNHYWPLCFNLEQINRYLLSHGCRPFMRPASDAARSIDIAHQSSAMGIRPSSPTALFAFRRIIRLENSILLARYNRRLVNGELRTGQPFKK